VEKQCSPDSSRDLAAVGIDRFSSVLLDGVTIKTLLSAKVSTRALLIESGGVVSLLFYNGGRGCKIEGKYSVYCHTDGQNRCDFKAKILFFSSYRADIFYPIRLVIPSRGGNYCLGKFSLS